MTDQKKEAGPVGHTPGPWKDLPVFVENEPCKIGIFPIKSWGKPAIAYVVKRVDARLIAAAPDLLAALRAMTEAFVRLPYSEEERHHALTIARAALAKAEGK